MEFLFKFNHSEAGININIHWKIAESAIKVSSSKHLHG